MYPNETHKERIARRKREQADARFSEVSNAAKDAKYNHEEAKFRAMAQNTANIG